MQVSRATAGRYRRIAVAAAVLAAVLVVAVGGGYSGSKALLTDGVAFAVDGAGLDRLNAATGTPDHEILDLARGSGRIRSVHRDGQLYVVDTATNTVSRVDPATLEVGPTTPPKPGVEADKVAVVTGGGTSALIDRSANTVQRMDADTLVPIGDPIATAGGLTTAVADAGGVLWVATKTAGNIVRVSPDGRTELVPVAAQGSPLTVTLVGGRPVAVDTAKGVVVAIDAASLERSERARLGQPPAGDLLVSSPDTPAPYLWLLDAEANALFRADLRTRKVDGPVAVGAGDVHWGQPVVQGGRVYAPNLGGHTMAVVDAETLERMDELAVPGQGPDFDLTLEGGALWANDPTSGDAVIVDRQGKARGIGKGEGQGRLQRPPQADAAPPLEEAVPPPAPPPPLVATPAPARPQVVAPAADTTVPDLTGLTGDQACAALAKVKLGCQKTDEEGGKIGKVRRQEPKAGTTLRPQVAVTVVLGLGVGVPTVKGSPRDAACTQITAVKLRCVAQPVPLERGKTKGVVIDQQPPASRRADEGAGVTVRYWGDARKVRVPDVAGKPEAAACAAVTAAGLVCQVKDGGQGDAPGVVASQAPAGGATADEGSTVVIVIPTSAKPAPVPNVVGSAPPAACAVLQSAGFLCRADDAGEGSPAKQIVTQTPAAGTTAAKGSLVVVVYYGSTAPTPPPDPTPTPTKVALLRYKLPSAERYRVGLVGVGGGWADDGILGYCWASATKPPGMLALLSYQKPGTNYFRHRVETMPLGADWGTPKPICWVWPPPGNTGGAEFIPEDRKPLLSMNKRGNPDIWFWTQSAAVVSSGGPAPDKDYVESGTTCYLNK